LDLKKDLTVFVISSGEPDYQACMNAINEQNCQFALKEIKNISPMNLAFQKMLDECETPFYIQVDADMILKSSAVAEMYEAMQADEFPLSNKEVSKDKVAFLTFLLRDVHLGINIYGVKIYNHSIMKYYPYMTSYSCEVDQMKRLKADGYVSINVSPKLSAMTTDDPIIMGLHSPTWTPERIFIRYKRLLQKYRRFEYRWLEKLPPLFLKLLKEENDPIEQWAFMGAIAGLTGPIEQEKEADISVEDEDFKRLSSLFDT